MRDSWRYHAPRHFRPYLTLMNRGRGFGGGPGFARPENALKRAEELEAVGQKHAALQTLHDIITSKRHRTWSKAYEQIMMKHIDLAVDGKKRQYTKEALSAYRNMCQSVNISSLEEVVKYFLQRATSKAEAAVAASAAVGCHASISLGCRGDPGG